MLEVMHRGSFDLEVAIPRTTDAWQRDLLTSSEEGCRMSWSLGIDLREWTCIDDLTTIAPSIGTDVD